MLPEVFMLWLQGFISAAAAANGGALTAEQVTAIQTEMQKVVLRGPFRSTPMQQPG